jgi:hypothetical protein
MPRIQKWIALGVAAIIGTLLFIAIGGVIVQQLWNWLVPSLFGWRAITFWQAIGLLALCRILFGGFGFHRSGRGGLRRRMAGRWERWTPEEQERFRAAMRARCGFEPSASGTKDL